MATTLDWTSGTPIAGTPFIELLATTATSGALSVLRADMAAGVVVAAHTHEVEDQVTIVVEGVVGATVGDEELRIEAGGVAWMPRGIPHSQWNASDTTARVLELYLPGGFERVFAAAGQAVIAGTPPTEELFARLRAEHAAGTLS